MQEDMQVYINLNIHVYKIYWLQIQHSLEMNSSKYYPKKKKKNIERKNKILLANYIAPRVTDHKIKIIKLRAVIRSTNLGTTNVCHHFHYNWTWSSSNKKQCSPSNMIMHEEFTNSSKQKNPMLHRVAMRTRIIIIQGQNNKLYTKLP